MQATWQFISVQQLNDQTKPHEILDDLEALLWVLCFIGVRCFQQRGNFDVAFFDDLYETKGGHTGRQKKGGSMKLSVFSGFIETAFDCPPLDGFLRCFIDFHGIRYNKALTRQRFPTMGIEEARVEFREEIEGNVYALLPIFDQFLQDPEADWSATLIGAKERQLLTEKEIQRDIRRAEEEHLMESWETTTSEKQKGKEQDGTAEPVSEAKVTWHKHMITDIPAARVNQDTQRGSPGQELCAILEEGSDVDDGDEEDQVLELLTGVPEVDSHPYFLRPRNK